MTDSIKKNEKAVSEVIGYVLLLSILTISISMIVAFALPTIQNAKYEAYLKNVEQGFTVLDSRLSYVALGGAPSQTLNLHLEKGSVSIENGSQNRLTIEVLEGHNSTEVYNGSIGRIEYTMGENKIAYEGGGVFRKYPGEGDPIIITPPEFHYNGETLTLPIIKINGNSSTGGTGITSYYMSSDNNRVIFPNLSDSNLSNPLVCGNSVIIVIKSDYYKAWAKYITERTDASATTYDAGKEVRIQLNTEPTDQAQDLEMPIDVFGFNVDNESALKNFSMVLVNGTSNFTLKLTTSSTSTEPYFTIEADKSGGLGIYGVRISVEYFDNSKVETWDWDVQALKVDGNFEIDFLNNNGSITYRSNDNSWTWINETSPYNRTYVKFDTGPDGRKIFQHYMSLVGPTFSLTPGTESGDPAYPFGFDPNNSNYTLYYDVTPPHITYFHLVEYNVQANVA